MMKVLIIGGHGRIAQLATEKLIDAGAVVTSLFRNPDHEADIRALGAEPLVQDLTEVGDWSTVLRGFDVVIWSAGNGGKAGAAGTYAVDRDGELAVIAGLEAMDAPPYYLTVSYLGWDTASVAEDGSSWAAYVAAKKAVGERLSSGQIRYTILAPAVLTDEPAGDAVQVDGSPAAAGATTSRELVAQVLAEYARNPGPAGTYAFIDA